MSIELLASDSTTAHGARENGTLGIWLFIASEILLFGGFLAGYVMIRWGNAACALGSPAWPSDHYTEGLALATFNTLLLVTSSWTMVRATLFARARDVARTTFNLRATFILGVIFLAVKSFEYALKIRHGFFPGSAFLDVNPSLTIFVSFYFLLTGLHALHVIAGLVWNGALLVQAGQSGLDHSMPNKLEYAGIYWHFVDVLWLFLFPLLYLI